VESKFQKPSPHPDSTADFSSVGGLKHFPVRAGETGLVQLGEELAFGGPSSSPP